MKQMKILILLFLFLINTQEILSQLGELPPNPTITKTINNVQIEISLGFWINPDSLKNKIPPNTKLRTVKSYGIPDSIISKEYQNWIDASLVILAADSIELNEKLITSKQMVRNTELFWWLQIEDGKLENEPNARGYNQAIEFGYWVQDTMSASIMNAGNWNTKIGNSSAIKNKNGWEFSIHVEDCSINGSCHLINDIKVENYELPAYSTIWQSGKETKAFTVYTFQGHKSQKCKIDTFEVQGDGTLANLLKESIKIQDPFCVVMFGWNAKAGHYKSDNQN